MLPKVFTYSSFHDMNLRSKHDMFSTSKVISLSIVTTHNFFVLHKKRKINTLILILSIFFTKSKSIFFDTKILILINIRYSGNRVALNFVYYTRYVGK